MATPAVEHYLLRKTEINIFIMVKIIPTLSGQPKKNNSEKVMALFPKVLELHKIKECSLYFARLIIYWLHRLDEAAWLPS